MASARTRQLVKTRVAAMTKAIAKIPDAAVMRELMVLRQIAAKKQVNNPATGVTLNIFVPPYLFSFTCGLNYKMMKKVWLSVLMMFVVAFSYAQFTKATLQATGLTCAMCSNAINKALQKVPFIATVRSDIKNSAFNIVFKEGESINIDALKKAVEDAGFSVGSLKITGNFQEVKIEKDKYVEIGGETFHFLNTDEQVLNGEQTISVVDKNYLTAKQFRKITSGTNMSCVGTGKAGSCSMNKGLAPGTRVYHVTI